MQALVEVEGRVCDYHQHTNRTPDIVTGDPVFMSIGDEVYRVDLCEEVCDFFREHGTRVTADDDIETIGEVTTVKPKQKRRKATSPNGRTDARGHKLQPCATDMGFDPVEIREFAKAQGMEQAPKGRIRQNVLDAFVAHKEATKTVTP